MLSPVSLGENLKFCDTHRRTLSSSIFSGPQRRSRAQAECFQQVKSTRHSPLLQLNDPAGCSQEQWQHCQNKAGFCLVKRCASVAAAEIRIHRETQKLGDVSGTQLREHLDQHLRLLRKYLLVTCILGCYVLDINHPCQPGVHLIRIPSLVASFKTWPSFLVAIKFNKISTWLSYLEAENSFCRWTVWE